MGFQKINVTRIGRDPRFFVNIGERIAKGMNLDEVESYFKAKANQYALDVENMTKIPETSVDAFKPGLLSSTEELKQEYLALTRERKKLPTNSEKHVLAGKRLSEINKALKTYDANLQIIDAIQEEYAKNPYMYSDVQEKSYLTPQGSIYQDIALGNIISGDTTIAGYDFRDKLYITHINGEEYSIDELRKPLMPNKEILSKFNEKLIKIGEIARQYGKKSPQYAAARLEFITDVKNMDQINLANIVNNNVLEFTDMGDELKNLTSMSAANSPMFKQYFTDNYEDGISIASGNNNSYTTWGLPGAPFKFTGNDKYTAKNASDLLTEFSVEFFGDIADLLGNAGDIARENEAAEKIRRENELLQRKNQNNQRTSKYTQETIDGINNIINSAIGNDVPPSDASDADLRDYERRYFERLGANVTATKEGINVVNKEEAKNLFLKDRTTEKQIIEKLESDAQRSLEAEDFLNFMGKIIKGNYNKNIPSNFMNLNHAEIPKQFFNAPQKDQEGVSFVTLTQDAINLLQEIGYIDDSAETVKAGTKRYYNFNAFVSDVKEMTFNRFLPGTTLSAPANLFVVTDLKGGGKSIKGLQGSILTDTGREILFNSIATSGLYPAQELRTASGSYQGPLSNIGVDNPN